MKLRFVSSVCTAAIAGWFPGTGLAQETPQAPTTGSSEGASSGDQVTDRNTIVVIGGRMIIAALEKVVVEQSYDEDAVASYGVGSVGEVLDEIRLENGDDQPTILVNGRPNSAPDEIASLPAAAIAKIEVLPKGSATRVGGAPGQRAYNVVLRASLKSATLTAAHEEATENGWSNDRGEAVLTYIKGQDRLNLSVRAARSTPLFESERNVAPRFVTVPYSANGNVIPSFGTEVDPLLSALAGRPIASVALPGGLNTPSLATLLPGAGQLNPSNESSYRTLRGPSRPIDITLAGNKQLNDWLSLSLNARLNWSKSEFWNGLPSATFFIPSSNPFTPFSTGVRLALNDPSRPLISRSDGNSQSITSVLNAQRGPWHAALTARWDRRENSYTSSFTGALGSAATLDDATNPFAGNLASLIPVDQRQSSSSSKQSQLQFEVQGPVASLWAGAISTRGTVAFTRIDYSALDNSGPRQFARNQLLARAGITLPLTSRDAGFLPALGDSSLDFDFGSEDLGKYGTLRRRSLAFNWQPAAFLRFNALDSRDERAVSPELLSAPKVVTPNVPYFDPVTGQTTEVTLIYGGAADLANEDYRTRSVAATLSPLKKYNLQFDAEYADNRVFNQVGIVPPPSSAVVAAFPERFVRDSLGYLTVVDSRSINFARQQTKSIRFGARFVLPLSKPGPVKRDSKGRASRVAPMRLAVTLNQTILLESKAVIRAGLPEVDLLDGGAVGIGGGQTRHSTRASIALSRGASGIRLDFARRGGSKLRTGSSNAPSLLVFDPLSTLNLRAFVGIDDLLPRVGIPRGTVLTMSINNLTNQRQRVTDQTGATPQAYQPVRRDPVGRTVMVELRVTL